MKRRSFVKASLLTSSLGSVIPGVNANGQNESSEEIYEVRVYSLKNVKQ